MTDNFTDVTELPGQKVTLEQLQRICHRYHWAIPFVKGKDVIEVACGAGLGLGFLAKHGRSLFAGDISQPMVEAVRSQYGDRVNILRFDAARMPFPDSSTDIILIYEAIYYLPDINVFLEECTRVLRPGGFLLLATANKDLYDFTPSPYSTNYYNVIELNQLLRKHGYDPRFWGHFDVTRVSLRQRTLRPFKAMASRFGLVPRTMDGKVFFKRLMFGKMIELPPTIENVTFRYEPPEELPSDQPNRRHKVIYCAAQRG